MNPKSDRSNMIQAGTGIPFTTTALYRQFLVALAELLSLSPSFPETFFFTNINEAKNNYNHDSSLRVFIPTEKHNSVREKAHHLNVQSQFM